MELYTFRMKRDLNDKASFAFAHFFALLRLIADSAKRHFFSRFWGRTLEYMSESFLFGKFVFIRVEQMVDLIGFADLCRKSQWCNAKSFLASITIYLGNKIRVP